jgi:enediyne biosynthesis protein E4
VNTAVGAFAALFIDYNRDGFIDLLVANGNNIRLAPTPNELFRNNGNLTFTDVAPQAGLAPTGLWMGFGPADYDNDGDIDLFVTNFGSRGFPHALYRNNGDGTYTDVGAAAGVALFPFAWGCAFKDFDNDGDADLFFAGALPGIDSNPGVLLFNNGDGTFTDSTASSPVDLRGVYASGVASGDYDRNGFEDIVVVREPYGAQESGHPVLLRNRGNANRWVTIHLVGTRSNRDAIGAQVWLTAGGRTQLKEVYAGSSFASTDSPWLTFGLGTSTSIDRVRVKWPLGTEEEFRNVVAGQTAILVEGKGESGYVGDCDGDGHVTVADLVYGVAIALGNTPLDGCPTFDADGDGRVDITELVQAVEEALS